MATRVRSIVRVITLPHATERHAAVASSLAAFPELDWAFFDGSLLAHELPYNRAQTLVCQGRDLTAGELGCFVSHVRLWKQFLSTGADQLLTLEDDTWVDWRAVRPLLEQPLPPQIDYLRLFAKRPAPARELGWLIGRRLIQYLHYCYGSQAYVLTRAGAARFVVAASEISHPIDDFMDRAWEHGIPNLALFPFPVLELSYPSCIGGVSRYQPAALARRTSAARLGYRVHDKLRRLAYVARQLAPGAPLKRGCLPGVTQRCADPSELEARGD